MITPILSTNFNAQKVGRLSFQGRLLFPQDINLYHLQDSFERSAVPKFVKKSFNYSLESESRAVLPYTGPLKKTDGFSTEAPYLGGGWLKASNDTPLSTTGVVTCAVLNLVNEEVAQQVLYHVFDQTSIKRIGEFIKEVFPRYTRVNLVGGEHFKTVETMNKIIKAVDMVDPFAPKVYYHTLCENPQLVAYKNEIYYIKGKSGQLSFMPNSENYWY